MTANDFRADCQDAAEKFVQTMIVVDDEATMAGVEDPAPNDVVRPGRGHRRMAEDENLAFNRQNITHMLDAKSLVDGAMDIGLVCSVLHCRQEENREQLTERVLKAAAQVDIVCLDWEIHDDDGATARSLIKDIVRHDQERGGRLRLIAIYTGERGRSRILNDIKASWPGNERTRMKLKVAEGREIRSAVGLKIVCLFKNHGTRLQRGPARDQRGRSSSSSATGVFRTVRRVIVQRSARNRSRNQGRDSPCRGQFQRGHGRALLSSQGDHSGPGRGGGICGQPRSFRIGERDEASEDRARNGRPIRFGTPGKIDGRRASKPQIYRRKK